MERVFPTRREAPANDDQIIDQQGRDPRASRDVSPGEIWAFVEHCTLAEIFAAEASS